MLITAPIAGLFEIVLPLALAYWLMQRYPLHWKLFGVGVLTFVGSQIVHIPVLNLLTSAFQTGALPPLDPRYAVLINAAILGLLAGIFEETARLIGFYVLKGQARSWPAGVALGIGHGGIESILLVGLPVLVAYLTMFATSFLPQLFTQAQLVALTPQAYTYWQTSWDLPLASAVERLSTMATHIALSLLVMQTFLRRNALFFVGAILWHAMSDGVTVVTSRAGWNTWGIEGAIFVFALVNLGIIWYLRPRPAPVPLPQAGGSPSSDG